MSDLLTTPFLVLDCQTTGIRPSAGWLLEFCWAEGVTALSESVSVRGGLVELPIGATIPPRVREITGLRQSDLAEGARAPRDHRDEFSAALISSSSSCPRMGAKPLALVHYAQFEEAWLRELLQVSELPIEMFCTHRIASKLFPGVPSRNIRGLTGYFGNRIGEIKRAFQHVQATHLIWRGLTPALDEVGVRTIEDLRAFMREKKKIPRPKSSYDYRVDREKRLAVPAKPGIYKMIAKSGEILYVGKATSLRDRVNSYFRGKKGRDPRKLEMMAQVWDLEVVECGSAIEAALIESDEIKRLNPPYNVSLKLANRALVYYDRTLTEESTEPSAKFCIGPFRRFNAVEHLRLFVGTPDDDTAHKVFYEPIDRSLVEEGVALFREKYGSFEGATVRDHVALSLRLWRANQDSGIETQDDDMPRTDTDTDADVLLSASDILEKIERLYLRAASTYLRAKEITRLLWSDVRWIEKREAKFLSIRGGKIMKSREADLERRAQAWKDLAISDYDRMSVLLTEISKVEHEIVALRSIVSQST